jgi:hypothetical protein
MHGELEIETGHKITEPESMCLCIAGANQKSFASERQQLTFRVNLTQLCHSCAIFPLTSRFQHSLTDNTSGEAIRIPFTLLSC